jgi:hypothetical protein
MDAPGEARSGGAAMSKVVTKSHGLLTLALVVLAGCASAHGSDEVEAGIYELTIESELDACSPLRPVGAMGAVAVLVDGGAIDAPVPDAEALLLASPRVRLAPDGLFHAETNRRVSGCDGAWVHEEWTVVEPSAEAFAISHLQRWEGLASCADPSVLMPGAPGADCSSERLLRYSLAERCLAPCSLRLTSTSTVACACD